MPESAIYSLRSKVLGAVALLLAPLLAVTKAEEVKLTASADEEFISIKADGNELLRYRQIASPCKPYLQALSSPRGVQVLRDAPEDHEHHHGLMFALRADDADFWIERVADSDTTSEAIVRTVGWQVPREKAEFHVEESPNGPYVVIHTKVDWLANGTKRLLIEDRKLVIQVVEQEPTCSLLSWRSRLEAAPEVDSVKLWGTHYAGLGMRFVEEMDHGVIRFPDNSNVINYRGSEHLISGNWCAYSASIGASQVTVALFDDPQNRRPATWFAMAEPFAYLSATIGIEEKPIQLGQGEFIDLRYGVAVVDGEPTVKQLEALRNVWLYRIP